MTSYTSLIIYWLLFFAVHSAMASSVIKIWVNGLHPVFKSYYRLTFNIVSIILLVPIVYIYFNLPATMIFKTIPIGELMGILLVIGGTYILIVGFKNYRTDEFIGIYQLKNNHEFHPSKLHRTGWNGVVRHPLYFGGILLATGLLLMYPTVKLILTTLLVMLYLYIGTLWEEKKLIDEFGDDYLTYKNEVSMLIPVKWIIRQIAGSSH